MSIDNGKKLTLFSAVPLSKPALYQSHSIIWLHQENKLNLLTYLCIYLFSKKSLIFFMFIFLNIFSAK